MNKLYNLSRLPALMRWMDFLLERKAIRFRKPTAVTVEKNEDDNTYEVNLHYPFMRITLIFDDKGELRDFYVIDIADLIEALGDIHDELRKLEG